MLRRLLKFTLGTLLACALAASGLITPAFATNVTVTGPWSAQISGTTSILSAARVDNLTTGGNSGSLRLELWAFDYPYAGGTQQGYHLADYQMSPLNGLTAYENVVSPSVATSRPAAGTWHLALLLTEYNGSIWLMRSYLLSHSWQTYVCSASSCSTVIAPTAVAIGTNRSNFQTHQVDTMSLSAKIDASTETGTLTDLFISVSLGNLTYYLDPTLQWTENEVAAVTDFSLMDVVAPDFYSLPAEILPAGNYTFRMGLAYADSIPNALRAYLAEGSTQVVYDDFPIITFPEVATIEATVGTPMQFSFAGLPVSSQQPIHYHFQLGTFGGFPPIGIILAPDGTLSGTPKVQGARSFAVCAVDESGSFGGAGRSTCQQVTVNVNPANAPPPTPPPSTSGPFLFANWSCGSSPQCASVMGGTQGSSGKFCSVQDCTAWGQQTIPGSYSCSVTASVASPRIFQSYGNGQCAVSGVDF